MHCIGNLITSLGGNFMFQLLGFIGSIVTRVVESQNLRDVEVTKSNNKTRIELAKTLLEGAALIGTMALSAYYSCKSNNSTDNNSSSRLLLKSDSYEPTNLSNEEEKTYIK